MKHLYATLLFCLLVSPLLAQRLTLSGRVRRADTGAPLPGATLTIKGTSFAITADSTARYVFRLPAGEYNITVSYAGFEPKTVFVGIGLDSKMDIELTEKLNQLAEVIVSGERPEDNIKRPEIGVSKLSIRTLRRQPALLGEVDVVRSLLLLPGVTTVGEGATGFNVRGGQIDQNLVLMDDAPIFNTGHLLGLFSVFNPDVVNTMTFYRGGVPAQYGGRASSVLAVRLRDANATRWQVKGGIGLVSSRLLIEGPMLKNKLAFYVAGRGSFSDKLLKLVPNPAVQGARAGFFDLTAKMEWIPSVHDRFFTTFYSSTDRFRVAGDSLSGLEVNASSSEFRWQTTNATAGWSHTFGPDRLLRVVGIRSLYQPDVSNPDSANAFTLKSGVLMHQLKADYSLKPSPAHQSEAGLSYVRYQIEPGTLTPTTPESSINPVTLRREQGVELAVFAQDEWTINPVVSIMAGLRHSQFINQGPGLVFNYLPNTDRDPLTVQDSTRYGAGQTVQTYGGLEPRFSAKISLSATSSIKLSYHRMRQYIQQISNTTAALPTARWKLSDSYTQPLIADQVSAGYFRNFLDGGLETSVEVYYKGLHNVTDYKDGISLLLLDKPETALLQGKGESYGVEVFIRKNTGRLTGWLSYTYSQTHYHIDNALINGGNPYPVNYNKPNSLNLVAAYQRSRRVSFSANFVISSGRPATYPQDKYYVGGIYIPNYVNRNADQIPAYHRLDVGMTVDPNPQRKSRFKSSWVFSIYNLYSRQNAFSVFFRTQNASVQQYYNRVGAYKLSVFGAIIPAITYNFQF